MFIFLHLFFSLFSLLYQFLRFAENYLSSLSDSVSVNSYLKLNKPVISYSLNYYNLSISVIFADPQIHEGTRLLYTSQSRRGCGWIQHGFPVCCHARQARHHYCHTRKVGWVYPESRETIYYPSIPCKTRKKGKRKGKESRRKILWRGSCRSFWCSSFDFHLLGATMVTHTSEDQ